MHRRSLRRLMPPPLLLKPYMDVPTGYVRPRPHSDKDLPPPKKQRLQSMPEKKKVPKKAREFPNKCAPEGVLWSDIVSILGQDHVDDAIKSETDFDSPYEVEEVFKVEIVSLCSTGEAIGLAFGKRKHPWAIVTRFCFPGETVVVKVYWNRRLHSFAKVLEVVTPDLRLRDDSRIKCQYFGTCGGCQYQMLSYDQQLKLKRDVIVKAYRDLSELPESSVPIIQDTVPSPLEYGYRTKITPHFDAPPKKHRLKEAEVKDGVVQKPEWLKIGFNVAGTHKTLDIEECPISTPTLNAAIPSTRESIFKTIHTYRKGVSLTMRDSILPGIERIPTPETKDPVDALSTSLEQHVCISDPKATVRERVGEWLFEYNASSFFQTNNSVLKPLTDYVRDAIFPSDTPGTSTSRSYPQPTHLVDAYCGSGLFSITLSPYFDHIAGIELSSESIKAAQHNARLNNIPPSKITFREGDAADIFASVKADFKPSKTVLIIDPPRKGCDEWFLQQVLDFRCGTIVYVSCNVHTQARDVGMLVNRTKDDGERRRYVVESLKGWDLFPQTAHVESVAVLRLA